MDVTGDELAGVVDLFSALTREELGRALVELAFKQRDDCDPGDFEPSIAAAVDTYHLVVFEPDGRELLVPGPVAFPELPEDATDLPHILDVPERSVDRKKLGTAVEERFRADTARAVASGDTDRIEQLLDVSYELDVWAPIDLADARARLNDVLS